MRGESLQSYDDESETEDKDKDDKCVEEKMKNPQGAPHVAYIQEVNKLPPFRGFDPILVHHDLNTCLPKLSLLVRQV